VRASVCPCGGGGCGVVERTGLATLFEVQLSSGIARWSAGRVFLGRERRVRRRGKKKGRQDSKQNYKRW